MQHQELRKDYTSVAIKTLESNQGTDGAPDAERFACSHPPTCTRSATRATANAGNRLNFTELHATCTGISCSKHSENTPAELADGHVTTALNINFWPSARQPPGSPRPARSPRAPPSRAEPRRAVPCRAVPAYRRLHNPRSGDNAGRSARHHGGPGRRSAAAPHRAPRRRRLPPPQRLRAGRDPRPPPRPLPSGEVAPTHPVPSRLGGREGWSSYPLLSSDPPGHPTSPLVSGGARSRLLSRPLPAETPAAAPPSRQLFLPPRRSRLLLRLPASRPLGRRVRVRHPASGAASAQLGSAHAQWNGAGADRISPRVPGARKREAGERERAAPGGDRKGRAVTGPGAMSQSAVPREGRMRSRRGAARTLRVGGGSWGRVTRLALPASRFPPASTRWARRPAPSASAR
ncbi:serine/arginine repetitive matrix protein 1-like [Gallus gallus]|uniref:serine/arginine repetitive matrix protein 1-like n=1 Tax=Gallus gallus TaxID=9031 RepID=UPI001AEB0F89|nr:serine/arginine repetitive matrix protein 1-like [Gallus gallus]